MLIFHNTQYMSVAPHEVTQSASVAPHYVTQTMSVALHTERRGHSIVSAYLKSEKNGIGVRKPRSLKYGKLLFLDRDN